MPSTAPARRRPLQQATSTIAAILLRLGSHVKQALYRAAALGPESDPPLDQVGRAPVAVYFADAPPTMYQLKQWLPIFELLSRRHALVVVTSDAATTRQLRSMTTVPVVLTRTIDATLSLYEQIDVKTIIYVNNGLRNFQSLIYQRALHVHVNHGESDKISMVSNQAKAYDKVVVAGQAAVERHRRALINFTEEKLAVCGRPQLDLDVPPALRRDRAGRRTVLYAPTWSGENEANNYTSLDVYGVSIVQAILAQDDVRLVYKPHPRVANETDPACGSAHDQVLRLVRAANQAGGEHLMPFDADPLAVLGGVDLLLTDISSIGLDFLYLHPETPIMLTDRRTDRTRLVAESRIADAVDVIDDDTVADVGRTIRQNLTEDPHYDARARARDHYFGFERGDSSARFLAFVDTCVTRRDELVASRASA